jgi:hypothetical protein
MIPSVTQGLLVLSISATAISDTMIGTTNHEADGIASTNDSLCQMLNIAASYHHYLYVAEEALELRTLRGVNGSSHPITFPDG